MGTEPVNDTAPTPGCTASAAPGSTAAVHDLHQRRRDPRGHERVDERVGARRRVLGRLEHDAVAGEQRGEALPRRDRHREVPGRDHPDDTDRLASRPRHLVRQLGRHDLTHRGTALAGDEAPHVDRLLHVASRLDQHLARLASHERGELGLARREHVCRDCDEIGTRGHGAPRPLPLRLGRGRNRAVDIVSGR